MQYMKRKGHRNSDVHDILVTKLTWKDQSEQTGEARQCRRDFTRDNSNGGSRAQFSKNYRYLGNLYIMYAL